MKNNELKTVCIKNRTRYYFNDIIKFEDIDFDNISLNEKSDKNILVFNISYKTLIRAKSLRIMLDKVDGFINVYDGTIYLVLFRLEKYDTIYDRIRYLLDLKSGITYVFFMIMQKSMFYSDDDLPLEETLTLHSVTILIRSVFNKNQNHNYYYIFLGKCSYQLAKK